MSPASKFCPKCRKSDVTDFSKCRFCGAFYDQAKNAVPQSGGMENFLLSKNSLAVVFVLVMGCWFLYAVLALNFDSAKWKANRGSDRQKMVAAVERQLQRHTGKPGDKERKLLFVNESEAREILGPPDSTQSTLLNKRIPATLWLYNVPNKEYSFHEQVWIVNGEVAKVDNDFKD